jgi:hypothetical protein
MSDTGALCCHVPVLGIAPVRGRCVCFAVKEDVP